MVELMNGIAKGYSPKVYFTDDENGLQGFRTINCTEELHPFAGAYWPPGHIIGYEHTFINLMVELMNGIAKGYSPVPNFEDGLLIRQYLQQLNNPRILKNGLRFLKFISLKKI
jgi:hypothetical protein